MLNLASETSPDWARSAASQIDEVLLDHAHCEKKAAGAAVRMLFRYPQHRFLQQPMTALAREELEHYERLLSVLEARAIPFARQKPSTYGARLHQLVRAKEPDQLVDLLLVSALIEARSCERFRLLSETLDDEVLARLYADLLASEARHHQTYVELAQQLAAPAAVRDRLFTLARCEAEILDAASSRVRLHSGHPRRRAMEIETERLEISVDSQPMAGYLARPTSGGPYPGVIVYMEIFGVNSHIRDITERVATEGYVALAPDYFHRTAPGLDVGYDEAGMAEGMKQLGQLRADQMIADAKAAIATLRARDDVTGKIGCMGFCIGGHMTYLTACETDVDAAASYYGGGIAAAQGPGGGESTVGRSDRIRGRLQCYFGGQDALIPPDQVAAIRQALAKAAPRHEVVVYDEADHGFHCDQRASYDPKASADAWARTLTLFQQEL